MDIWEVCYLMKQISDRLRASVDMNAKKYGITFTQLRVLNFIESRGGETTQKEIEDHLGVSHPTVVGLVIRLEKSGFLYCYMDESNRRNKNCCVTRRGKDTVEAMTQERLNMEKRLVQGISETEQRELKRLLRTLLRNLE